MRLFELMNMITPSDIKGIERRLDDRSYMPVKKLEKDKPVLDLELPTDQHFMQRIIQRSGKAQITPQEIEQLLQRAKSDPAFGYKDELEALSKQDRPLADVVIQDPDTKLTIPAIVKPNPICKPGTTKPDCPTCQTTIGKQPKNKIVAKTIFRKGVGD